MKLHYQTKWADETAWAAIVTSLATVVGLLVIEAGLSEQLSLAVTGLVGGLARLVLGAILPSPPLPEP